MKNPITTQNIQTHQFEDLDLNGRRETSPHNYPIKTIQGRPLICFKNDPASPKGNWKIAIPQTLLEPIIQWYHLILGHCGCNQLYKTIRMNFAAPYLYQRCSNYKCNHCQRNKILSPGYGLLPPRHAPLMSWSEVSVDLIGPWKVKIKNQEKRYTFKCTHMYRSSYKSCGNGTTAQQDMCPCQPTILKLLAESLPESQQVRPQQWWRIHWLGLCTKI